MLEELKKRSLKCVLIPVIIMTVIAVGLLVWFGPDFITYVKGPVAFESLEFEDIGGQYVQAQINLDFGTFAEEITTTKSSSGYITNRESTSRYYVILVGGVDRYVGTNDYFQFVGVQVPKKYYSAMNTIDDNSDTFFERYNLNSLTTTLQVCGMLKPLEGDMLRYYKEFFEDNGYTDEEFEAYCAPYYIDVEGMKHGSDFLVITAFLVAVVLLVIAVYKFVNAQTGGYQKSLIKYLKEKGDFELDRASGDYQSGKKLAPHVTGGRIYIFDAARARTRAFRMSDIDWAYTHQTNHKKYGRTVSITYQVMLYMPGKKHYSISMDNSDSCNALLRHIAENSPGTIIGYSAELKQKYTKNYEEFQRLRAEKAERSSQAGESAQ